MIAGTSADQVHRCSAIQSQKLRTTKWCGITTEPPVKSVDTSVTVSALMWYSGSTHKLRLTGESSCGIAEFQPAARIWRCDRIAPLGCPVLPEVYIRSAS